MRAYVIKKTVETLGMASTVAATREFCYLVSIHRENIRS